MLQLLNFSNPLSYFFIIAIALVLVLIAIPSIIYVANNRNLFDDIDVERKEHQYGIARLGGVAIFCSFMITCLIFPQVTSVEGGSLILACSMILFAVGLKDDLWGVNPSTKFGMQLIVALIMVVLGNARLTSLYGILGIHDIPYVIGIPLSALIIMFVMNAFNLIDGIDGLAGITGLVVNISLGIIFIEMGQTRLAIIAFALAGACVGFLRYNLTPAKIFMGDTGSLLLGFISVILCIRFIELNKVGAVNRLFYSSAPSIAVAILIGPVFDAMRVFTLRVFNRTSPFKGDRNHVHHRMLYIGLTHLQATFILMLFNVSMIVLALFLRDIGNLLLMGILFFVCILFNSFLSFFVRSKERKSYRLVNFLW
ncbi:MraY family glycosyltransferase [Rubrolithibacter danxiaensis]|uniref:MraY family glycosyltransferase n=1 Tax=Rubrolithibacter danxiaensis TaxID=3390805 RepID=UPI003BF78527